MMKTRLLVALLAAVALVATGCSGKNAVDQTAGDQFRFVSANTLGKTWAVGDRKQAGEFTGELLDGSGTFRLSQDAGKVVVVNYWAQWCPPCRTETPQFDSVYRAYKDKGVAFVGVDFKDLRGKARHFVENNDISYPIVYDQQGRTAIQLGDLPALGLPFTVLIDKQQRVAAVYTQEISPKDLEPVLDKLLAEPLPKSGATQGAGG